MVKNLPANTGDVRDVDLIHESGRSSGGEGMITHSNILSLENPMDRGAWQASVHRVTKSRTQLKLLSMCSLRFLFELNGLYSGDVLNIVLIHG